MEPGAEILLAAERIRRSLEQSTVWVSALGRGRVQSPAVKVLPIGRGGSYFLVAIAHDGSVTARFALSETGTLLEAEGTQSAEGGLQPWVMPPHTERTDAGSDPAGPLVWGPCDQSTTRLRPFYEVPAKSGKYYLRVDGATFEQLTIAKSKG